jgi:hypothetical protein
MDNFDLKKFLVENRLTANSKILSEQDSKVEADIENKLSQIATQLQSAAAAAKPSPKDGELDEVVLTLSSLVIGAPGLITFLGKAADGIADVARKGTDSAVFKKDTYKKGGSENLPKTIGQGLRKAGHKLEEFYLESLGGWLTTAFPKRYVGQNVEDKTSILYDDAHSIYAGLLVGAALVTGLEAVHSFGTIVGGLEGGATALKLKEVLDIAQKIAAA